MCNLSGGLSFIAKFIFGKCTIKLYLTNNRYKTNVILLSSYCYCTVHVGMLQMFSVLCVSTKMEEGRRESIPQHCLQKMKIVMKM